MLFWIVSLVLVLLLGMGGVAFITLLERKLLGLSQVRLGPNKLTLAGVLQPVADGVKLLFKELYLALFSQVWLFGISPLVLMTAFCIIWSILPWKGMLSHHGNVALLYFSILGVGAYAVILSGWNIMSSFSKIGGLRGILQSLSYEVALILLFMVILVIFGSFSLKADSLLSLELLFLWVPLWLLLSMMETNRAPFDLLEGESELISGFNIEMGSLLFVYLFLSEYGMIILMSVVASLALLSSEFLLGLILSILILLCRSCFPRLRYDVLMGLMWQSILPLSLIWFFMAVLM